MIIAINGNRHQEGHFQAIERLTDTLVSHGHHVVMAEQFLDYLASHLGARFSAGIDYLPLTRQPEADLAISIGGDGAFLNTCSRHKYRASGLSFGVYIRPAERNLPDAVKWRIPH